MKKLYKAIAMVLAICIMMAVTLTANATVFSDVDADTLGQEAFDAIMYVSDNGIMTGNGDGTFTPNAAMTRAQLAKLLYNHSGASGSYGTVPFTDVPTGAWYYDAVSWAYNNGIMNGYTDTLFNPNGAVTREQTVTMLYRYATDYLGYSFSVSSTLITSHSDYTNISTYARTPMNWALGYNIIVPASSSSALLPKTNTIRAVIAQYMFAFEVHVVGYSTEKHLRFVNNTLNFGIDGSNSGYRISSGMRTRLRNYINSYYGTGSETANKWLTKIDDEIDETWGGACHGMTMVTYLDAQGKIDFNTNAGDYATMNSIPVPRLNNRIRSGIHYYQITYSMGAQFGNQYRREYSNANFIMGTNDLIAEVENNGSAVFAYAYTKSDGVTSNSAHTVLVTDITYTGGQTYVVTCLDPNEIGPVSRGLSLNSSTGSMTFGGKNIYVFTYFSKESADEISFFDIDGEYNNLSIISDTAATASMVGDDVSDDTKRSNKYNATFDLAGKMLVELPCLPFELVNAAGEYLSYADGKLRGTMTVYSDVVLANGDGNQASLLLVIDDTSGISYATNTGSGSIFACGDDYSVSVSGSGISKVYASSSEYEVYGENVDCTLKVSTKIDGWEFLSVNCSAERQIVLQHGDGMSITGVRGDIGLRFSNYALERSQEVVFSPVTKMVFMDLSKLKAENVVSIKEASRKEDGISLRFDWIEDGNTGGT